MIHLIPSTPFTDCSPVAKVKTPLQKIKGSARTLMRTPLSGGAETLQPEITSIFEGEDAPFAVYPDAVKEEEREVHNHN